MKNKGVTSDLDIVDSGTVTAPAPVGTNVLNDNTKNWSADVHKNKQVRIVGGPGIGQFVHIEGNSDKSLIIRGTWAAALAPGSQYVILGLNLAQVLRDVFGGGADISASNPLQVYDPAVEEKVKYTEDSVLGNSGGDGAWHDALDLDTRGMKSFSAVVHNTDGANS